MNTREAMKLPIGLKISHTRYGESIVEKVIQDFGVVIRPTTERGKLLLAQDSGAIYGSPLLEDSLRNLKQI